jgi:hypothetical protein
MSTRQQLDEALDACLKALTTLAEAADNAPESANARNNAEAAEHLSRAVATLAGVRPHF